MEMWNNGEKANVVRAIIEKNFKILSKHLPHNILALSTTERELLGKDYLCDGLLVYDTTKLGWFKYNARTGVWETDTSGVLYIKEFSKTDWEKNSIYIPFSVHRVSNPYVQLFQKHNSEYVQVLGGVSIDANNNITLSTDLIFNGKVVIK